MGMCQAMSTRRLPGALDERGGGKGGNGVVSLVLWGEELVLPRGEKLNEGALARHLLVDVGLGKLDRSGIGGLEVGGCETQNSESNARHHPC